MMAAESNAAELISALDRRIDEALEPLLPVDAICAHIDFPNHSNVGDSAIWLGESTFLGKRAARVVYRCDLRSYNEMEMRRRVGDGIILLHGGGNLGDVWPDHQLFRERVISAFPKNPIIQLPQSLHFGSLQNLSRARKVFESHPNLTLLLRDKRSLEIAGNEFETPGVLCPDMAFSLGSMHSRTAPDTEILWLARTDHESTGETKSSYPVEVVRVDWVKADVDSIQQRALVSFNRRLTKKSQTHARLASPLLSRTYDALARRTVQRGCDLLSRGRAVITDRLHGHILSLLLGIPHVLIDNKYGKLSSYYETWTNSSELAEWASSPDEALERARAIREG